ncbi:MAG: hypothetical protein U0228_04600 [Myxococcaceae bacterium]
MRPARGAVAALAVLVVGAGATAGAQQLQDRAPPLHRIVHKNTLAVRYNPLGLIYDGRFSYRLRLYENEGRALRDNFIGVGVAPTASPAFVRIGPYVEFNPLTMFGVWAMVQFVQYFGSFDLLQGFPGAQSNFSDASIKLNRDNRLPANGWELTLGATFQAKVGPIVVRSMARLVNGHMKLRDGDRIYYDQFYDVGAPNDGWTFTNDLDVLYQGLENKLIAGARYTATVPLYDPTKHYDPNATEQSADNGLHRLGPLIGYNFKIEDGAKFNNPTVFILVQWWLKHRFRTETPALPLMGVGFQVTGDFLSL